MKGYLPVLLLIFLTAFSHLNAYQGKKMVPEVNLIIIDHSGSMVGIGDGKGINIFSQVKQAAAFFINRARPGSYMLITPFSRNIETDYLKLRIQDTTGISSSLNYINSLSATGTQTWMTLSYSTALLILDDIIKQENFFPLRINVFVFTDGKGNGPGDENVEELIKIHRRKTSGLPQLYTKFIAIGDIFTPREISLLEKNDIEVCRFNRSGFLGINAYLNDLKVEGNGKLKIPIDLEIARELVGTKATVSLDKIKEVEEILQNPSTKYSTVEALEKFKKMNLDSMLLSKRSVDFKDRKVSDTITVDTDALQAVIDSLLPGLTDSMDIRQLNSALAITTDQKAGAVFFPDNKIDIKVKLTKGRGEAKTAASEFFDNVKKYLLYIIFGILVISGLIVFYLYRSLQNKKNSLYSQAYREADITPYFSGKRGIFSLTELFREIITPLQTELAGIQIDIRISPAQLVSGDRAAVRKVFEELLKNAVDAVNWVTDGPESKKILIKAADDGPLVRIQIANSGQVIPSDREYMIFRQPHSTKQAKGMGLIICHKIVTALKGKISYEPVTRLILNEATGHHEIVNTAATFVVILPGSGSKSR